jgi:hypothetical protein
MRYRVMGEQDEDGFFVAECPSLPGYESGVYPPRHTWPRPPSHQWGIAPTCEGSPNAMTLCFATPLPA